MRTLLLHSFALREINAFYAFKHKKKNWARKKRILLISILCIMSLLISCNFARNIREVDLIQVVLLLCCCN